MGKQTIADLQKEKDYWKNLSEKIGESNDTWMAKALSLEQDKERIEAELSSLTDRFKPVIATRDNVFNSCGRLLDLLSLPDKAEVVCQLSGTLVDGVSKDVVEAKNELGYLETVQRKLTTNLGNYSRGEIYKYASR